MISEALKCNSTLSTLNLWVMKRMIKETGTILPMTLTAKATQGLSPMATPEGSAPRSSMTGTIDIKKVIMILPAKVVAMIIYRKWKYMVYI